MIFRTLLFFVLMYFLVKVISRLFLSSPKEKKSSGNFNHHPFRNFSRHQNRQQNRNGSSENTRFEEIEEAEFEDVTDGKTSG